MKVTKFLAIAALSIATIGCSNDETPTNNPNGSEENIKELTIPTSDYGVWTYIDLKTGKSQTATVKGPWAYIDKDNKTHHTSNPEIKGEIPENWDIAFHYYDICTNEGEAIETNNTQFNEIKEVPSDNFTEDTPVKAEEMKIIVDMKDMQKGLVGYAKGHINPTLCKWVTKTPTGTMPPYKYEVNNKIFIVKCKNGNWAKLKFLDRLDGTGKQKVIKFSYEYISK